MGMRIYTSDTKIIYGTKSSLPVFVVEGDDVYGVVALQGAQILEFKAKGCALLWLSPRALFEEGKSIRGGIPVCAPWFGIHPDAAKPKHGFVRNNVWQLSKKEETENSATLVFEYEHEADFIFPHNFLICYEIRFSSQGLTLNLEVENKGQDQMPFGWAFHSYHPVTELAEVQVTGLEGNEYLDATQKFLRLNQNGPVVFDKEIDRVYENVSARQVIKCMGEEILIQGDGCPTAIVWNPGAELAQTLSDVKDCYNRYVCLERGAAFGDIWEISPYEKKSASLTIARSG